ncbi:hypothetical protein LSAT2_014402 [Lamellibrachia satsuma]|nr:hypothetical protein LSAT2_014402 [Lamellibrachia satsuma]
MYSCGISTRQELCSSAKEDRKKGYNPLLMQQDCISRGPTTMLWFQPHSVHPELPDITPMGWKLESKDLVLFHSISKQQFRAVVRRSASTTTTAAECLEDRVPGYEDLLSARRKPDVMAKFFVALLVLVAIYAAEANYDGCYNGFNYDCCNNRRSNFFYPSLSKPMPYYYYCQNRRVQYGRCPTNQCVTVSGSCGMCNDRCAYSRNMHSYSSSYFVGRYYYECNRGAMSYHSCGNNQSFYPGRGRCGCRENYCEKYSGWQSTVCNGCGSYTSLRLQTPSLCQLVQQLLWLALLKSSERKLKWRSLVFEDNWNKRASADG